LFPCSFKEKVQSAILVETGDSPFHLPSASAVADFFGIVPKLRVCPAFLEIPASDCRFDAAFSERLPESDTVIPLVRSEAPRSAETIADAQSVNGWQSGVEVVDAGFGGYGDKRDAVTVNQNAPF
jgi:hypothetical protein